MGSGEDHPSIVTSKLKQVIGPRTELVMTFFEDGRFGYYFSGKKGFSRLAKEFSWLLTDTHIDQSGIVTGEGYYASQWFDACFWQCKSEKESVRLENIIRNTWQWWDRDDFFPHHIPLRHFKKESYDCYFLYDYYSNDSKHVKSDFDKRVRNLIFRMKEGVAIHWAVRSLSKAMNNQFITAYNKSDMIVPIPASHNVSHTRRYLRFCQLLSWYTGIKNGYDTLNVVGEKIDVIPKSLVSINHIELDSSKLKGRSIYLVDDVYTTGTSFMSMAEMLRLHGAEKVTGIFLSKTNFDNHNLV